MSDEPVTTRELVEAFRRAERPSEAAKERMARALAAAVPAPRSATVIPLRPPRRRGRTISIGWLAAAAALLLVGMSSYWLVNTRHVQPTGPADLLMAPQDEGPTQGMVVPRPVEADRPTRPVVVRTEAPVVPAPAPANEPTRSVMQVEAPVVPAPAPANEPAPPPIVEETPRKPARPRPAERAPTNHEPQIDPVLAELVLIQRIKDALDADEPAAALAAIDAHAREFARGSLAEEREALRVVALCQAGPRERGEAAQQTFLRAYPRSAYRERVRAACPVAAAPAETTTID